MKKLIFNEKYGFVRQKIIVGFSAKNNFTFEWKKIFQESFGIFNLKKFSRSKYQQECYNLKPFCYQNFWISNIIIEFNNKFFNEKGWLINK